MSDEVIANHAGHTRQGHITWSGTK